MQNTQNNLETGPDFFAKNMGLDQNGIIGDIKIEDETERLLYDTMSENQDFQIEAIKRAFEKDQSFSFCIELQNKVNAKKIGENWLQGENITGWPIDFSIASLAEIGEYLGSSSYEWWKKVKTRDYENMITELIDVMHFEISKTLEEFPNDPELRNAILVSSWASSDLALSMEEIKELNDFDKQTMLNQLVKKLTFFIVMPDEFKPGNIIESHVAVFVGLFDLFKVLDVSKEDVIKRYYIKNALNTLRSNFGYKTGEYVKSWIDVSVGTEIEDNYIAVKICKNVPLNFDNIYETLETYYKEYVLIEKE